MYKKNIVIVFHSSNIQSGATKSLMNILDNLLKTKKYYFITIFPSSEGTAIDYLKKYEDVEIITSKYGYLMQDLTQSLIKRIIKLPILVIRHLSVILSAKRVSKLLKDKEVDLVYSNTSSIIFGGYLGRLLKCKQVWHIREFRVKDHRFKFYLGEKWLKNFINDCSEKVMYVSKAVMLENIDIIPEDKTVVTYNSYDKSFINPKKSFNYDNTSLLNILIAGDIKESKGQLVVTESIQYIKEKNPDYKIKLYIAGRESNKKYYNRLVKYIIEKGLKEDVILLGQVSNMKELREKIDIGVVASTCEAFGRTTIEGMLSMIAMIGRNSGGTTEQINNDVTGLLYDGTVEELANCICELYNDRKKLEQLSINGFREAVEKYTCGNCYKTVENVIDGVFYEK